MSILNVNNINPYSGNTVTITGLNATGSIDGTSSYSTTAETAPTYTLTSSFGAFTGSYITDSSSFDNRITAQENFSSSLDASFVNEIEFGVYTSSIDPKIASLEIESGSIRTDFNAFTSSYNIFDTPIQLNPTEDPGVSNITSSFLFVSSSKDNSEFNLHYRNNGALWEQHWLEERTDTGLVWGGVVTFSGTQMFITPGAGIIINHNANTASHGDTVPTYVTFGPITASATFITSSQLTYLLIDQNGDLVQQTSTFTPQQYNDQFPLGYITHLTTSSISAYADARVTTYGQDEQQSQFIRAFGPLRLSGFDITPQPSSLKLTIASGRTYRAGGFYKQNPDNPSVYDTTTVLTSSMVRIYKDPVAVGGFKAVLNGLVPFTDIDPTKWDDGTGTLQTVGASEWTIQRAFQGAINGITYVYYGQNKYDSLAAAIQSISTEAFEESAATQISLPFIGYIICKGDTSNLADTTNNKIIQAGLFRNTAGSSGGGGVATTVLNDLSDVTITSPATGQALVYNSGFWINGTPTNTTSASFASLASTASYVTLSQTASFVNTAQTASFVLNAVSASFATSASRAVSASFSTTASHAVNALTTASVSNNTITFTKGDGTTFPITVNTGSSAASITYTAISSSTPQTINSGTFTILTGTPTTLAAGTYKVLAVVYGANAANNSTFESALFYGGVAVPATTATIASVAGQRSSLTMQHILVADGVTSFDIRARITTAFLTNNVSSYYLTFLRIA